MHSKNFAGAAMGQFSDTMDLVLNYGPRAAHHDYDRTGRVYLVWPCAAWRVVAPAPSDQRINLLQKAVLGLWCSNSYSVAEIATKLHLHPHLVENIGMELVRSGWVDQKSFRPTPKGLDVLEKEELIIDTLITGWVFQDPWSGELWPHFSQQLQLQETTIGYGLGRLNLALDSKRGLRKVPAWTFDAPASPVQPSSAMILRAVKQCRRREEQKKSMRLDASEIMGIAGDDSPELLARIASISDQPEPAGLVTFGYLPKGSAFLPQICDPFGFGCDEKMWRQLQRIARDDEGAAGAQRDFLRFAQIKDAPALEELLEQQQKIAESEVVARLSLDIKATSAVFEHLVAAAKSLSLARATEGESQSDLGSVMQSCRRTLEALLKSIARVSSLSNAPALLNGDVAIDRATVDHIAQSIGLRLPLPGVFQIDKSGGKPNKGLIIGICRDVGNVYKLPSAVVATLLASSLHPVHPLRKAASKDVEFLRKLARIIDLGNAGSHDDSHNPSPKRFSISEAEEMWELIIHATGCLLNLATTKPQNYEQKRSQ
ncbi:MAG: hypothetical protein IPH59_08870 [bacterium]|nr:hypothetical protein [bacterium]